MLQPVQNGLSPLRGAYWKSARAQLKSARMLALAGLVSAMAIVLESFPVFLMGATLKIYFSFLVLSVGACVYGPVMAMLAGAVIDTLGFMIAGFGEPYFPGYLLTAVLSGLIYGLFLYRRRLTVLRLLALKLTLNYGVNVLLGSVWKAMLYGKGYYYYFVSGLVKNTVLLPLEVALLAAVFRLLLPVLQKSGLLPAGPKGKGSVPWF